MHALEINNLQKTYSNGQVALKGINLYVKEGDFFALLGANGAGKSTTIGIITSLVNKSAGSVKLFGHNLQDNPIAAKRYVGLVPQEFNCNIFETAEQVLINQAGYYGVPRKLAKTRAKKYLQQLGLWDKKDTITRQLSGGMKRRLMIARALMHEPKMLILDEPTAGVDIEIRHSMWDFLTELNHQGTTIILTTHYLEEAEQLCKHIAIIKNGKIEINESIGALLTKVAKQSFVLNLVDPLKATPTFERFQSHLIEPYQLEIYIDNTLTLNDVFNELTKQRLFVQSLRTKSNRLEALFLGIIKNDH